MYITDITTQLKNIMPALGLGFALGIVYEFVRILRVYISSGKIFVFITDMLFTVFCSVSTFLLFVAVNNGHIRFYMLLAGVLGYTVCLFTAGELLYAFFVKIHSFLIRILKPILKPFEWLLVFLSSKFKKLPEKTEKIKNKFKKLLKHRDEVVYNKHD